MSAAEEFLSPGRASQLQDAARDADVLPAVSDWRVVSPHAVR